MNAQQLTRLYDQLTVWERIPLLIAADARKDETEYQRLFDASPIRAWHFSEHLMAEQVLHILALTYVAEQLNAAANYFFAMFQYMKPDDPRPEAWLQAADASAYFFTVNAEAWRQFCSELGISSSALTAANHQGWFLSYCEENMPAYAPSADALQERFRESGQPGSQPVTVERLLASRREVLRAATRHAPPDNTKGAR